MDDPARRQVDEGAFIDRAVCRTVQYRSNATDDDPVRPRMVDVKVGENQEVDGANPSSLPNFLSFFKNFDWLTYASPSSSTA